MTDRKFEVFQEIRSMAAAKLNANGFTEAEAREVGEMLTEDLPTEIEEVTAKDAVADYCLGLVG